jgi:hypothetical protein
MKEFEAQSRQLDADQVFHRVVFSQVKSRCSGQDIGNVFASHDFRVLMRLPESFVGNINQRVEDLRAEKGSVAVVGAFSNNFRFENEN